MLTLIEDDDSFNEAAARAARAISEALAAIVDDHDPETWFTALAVCCGREIREAQLQSGMPEATALMLVNCIRDFALGKEPRADS